MARIRILQEYEDGLIIQWNNSIWTIRPDGNDPSLWPVALLSKDESGRTVVTIPKGTDAANAHAVLTLIGLPDLFE